MKDYLPCINKGRNSFVRFVNYTSNFNSGLSPLQNYGKATLLLNFKTKEATAMIISLAIIWEGNSHVRFHNYKTNCNLGYLPCINMRRQLVLDLNYKSNRKSGLSPLQKYGNATLVLNIKTIPQTAMKNYLPCIDMGR